MASKKNRLIKRAAATTRKPEPTKLLEAEKQKKSYRVVAVNLYTPEAEWIDHTSKILQLAGNPKANRSLVVRESILRLQEDLKGKNPDQTLRYFIERHAKRAAIS